MGTANFVKETERDLAVRAKGRGVVEEQEEYVLEEEFVTYNDVFTPEMVCLREKISI